MSIGTASAVFEAARVLQLTQRQLADHLGISSRTVSRKTRDGWVGGSAHFQPLARAVHPRRPELAAQLAALAGTTIEALGLVPPVVPQPVAPEPAAPREPPAATVVHLDAVVCAAADALDLSPRALRAGIAAAFARAHQTGLPLDAFATAFAKAGARPVKR